MDILSPDDFPPTQAHYWLVLPPELDYLGDGDVLWMQRDSGELRVLWRASSKQNFLLLTERCDNYCLMCSQPPREREDSWLMDQARRVAAVIPSDTQGVVLTGGEPTLYGAELGHLVADLRSSAPDCHVLILSNGRRFADVEFAEQFAAAADARVTLAIPLYGAESRTHDYVVQARGAFQETIGGILNLAALGVRVEVRVVLHKLTIPILNDLAEYISRNLPFVSHIALMGLELTGLTRKNLDELWIDPYDYRHELADAVALLAAGRLPVSVYNLPLCLLEPSVRRFAVRSISDWKNKFEVECETCSVVGDCAGFFRSVDLRQSSHIQPLKGLDEYLDASVPKDIGVHRGSAVGVPVRISRR